MKELETKFRRGDLTCRETDDLLEELFSQRLLNKQEIVELVQELDNDIAAVQETLGKIKDGLK